MIKKLLDNRLFILYFLPFLIGSLSVLSFQPFNLTFINLIIFPIFFYVIIYISKKSKSVYRKRPYKINLFLFGLFFGLAFYLSGISWIVNSLTFDESFKIFHSIWLDYNSVIFKFIYCYTSLISWSKVTFDYFSLIIFSGSLAFSDYLRAKLFTGFPWNMWAYSTSWINEIIQIINHIGLYAYNLIVITLFTFPIIIFLK